MNRLGASEWNGTGVRVGMGNSTQLRRRSCSLDGHRTQSIRIVVFCFRQICTPVTVLIAPRTSSISEQILPQSDPP